MVSSKRAILVASLLVVGACSSFSSSSEPPTGGPDAATPEGGATDALDAADTSTPPGADAALARYPAAVLADGPIAYWRMGAKVGPKIPNEVDPSNALILQGSAALGAEGALTGDVDTAMRLDGLSTGYAVAENARPFDFAGGVPFTIEWWAKHDIVAGGATFQHMIGAATGSTPATGNGYFVYWSGDNAVQAELAAPTLVSTLTASPVAPMVWKYYALVFDGADVSLVIDGTVAATKAAIGKPSARSSAFVVGATSGTTPSGIGGYGFAGLIDEVAVYAKNLTVAQLATHFSAAK
jgi:hypothetical protein